MKNLLFPLLFSLMCFGYAQEAQQRISISFEDTELMEVLVEIEESSDYRFFFLDQWLTGIKITCDYQDTPIKEVVNGILKNTDIHFIFMENNQVVLTKNNLVYDKLPNDFFGKKEDLAENEMKDTVNTGNKLPLSLISSQRTETNKMNVVRIGKERRTNSIESYTLKGRVTGKADGQPIANLALIVQESGNGTVTDSNGNYELDLPMGKNSVQTKGLGFRDTQTLFVIYNNGVHNFQLDESVEALDEVIVQSNRNKNVEQALTGVTTIEVEKIKTMPLVLGEQDILKAAISMPGISTAGEGASGYNVRGGRIDQNLILLDEGVIYNPAHFFGIFSAINPFSTSSATIYKGHIPVEFGGRLSSVFDLRSKKGNKEKFSGEASIGPVTGNAVLEIPLSKGKSSLMVGGRATYSDWILKALDDEQLQNSEASFYDIIAKYDQVINENNSIEATGYFSQDAFSVTSDSIFDYSNLLASIKWNHQFNESNSLGLVFSNSSYGFGITYDGQSNSNFKLRYKNNEIGVKAKMKSILNPRHTLDYGIAGKLYDVDPGRIEPEGPDSEVSSLSIPDERGLESAVFLSDSYKANDKLLLDFGMRYSVFAALGPGIQRLYEENAPRNSGTLMGTEEYDDNEFIKTYGGPEARVSARYFLSPSFSIKASYNNGIQYIHTLSNNTTASPTDTWKLSDYNIEPQRAAQTSLGLYKNFDGGLYELSLEGYYKKQKNLLDYKVGAQLLMNEAIETEVLQGDGKAYGLEFLLKKNEGRLNGWLAYSYSRSFVRLDGDFNEERVNGGEFFPSNYDKPHDLSIVANYKFTKRFSASANFVYQTGRPVTFPIGKYEYNNAEYVAYSDRNKYRIPDYYRLDLSFNVEGNHKIKKLAHSFWSISVYNVLGRNNPYSVFFATEDGAVKAYQSSIFSIPVPTITYNFKF